MVGPPLVPVVGHSLQHLDGKGQVSLAQDTRPSPKCPAFRLPSPPPHCPAFHMSLQVGSVPALGSHPAPPRKRYGAVGRDSRAEAGVKPETTLAIHIHVSCDPGSWITLGRYTLGRGLVVCPGPLKSLEVSAPSGTRTLQP